MQRYNVGSSKHWTGATVFWQVDISGRIRTGKVMLYNHENGRRIKEPHNYITWVHSLLKKEKFHFRQCLFGEHRLPSDTHRTVALVESRMWTHLSSGIQIFLIALDKCFTYLIPSYLRPIYSQSLSYLQFIRHIENNYILSSLFSPYFLFILHNIL